MPAALPPAGSNVTAASAGAVELRVNLHSNRIDLKLKIRRKEMRSQFRVPIALRGVDVIETWNMFYSIDRVCVLPCPFDSGFGNHHVILVIRGRAHAATAAEEGCVEEEGKATLAASPAVITSARGTASSPAA